MSGLHWAVMLLYSPSPARPRYGLHMKIRYEFGERHRIRDAITKEKLDEAIVTHYVNFYTQPFLRHWAWKLYHRYDMNRVVHYVSHHWLPERKAGHFEDGTPFTLPWCAAQDCRCYELSRKGRKELTSVDITQEQRDLFRRAKVSETSIPD